MRRSANRRHALTAVASSEPVSPERSSAAFRSGNERLYEAYNDLHSLAQDFEKPFDAPAILVIGQQTDGKSGEVRQCLPDAVAVLQYCLSPCHSFERPQ